MIGLIFISLVIPLVSIVLGTYPRIANRSFGVDIWTHLLYLREYHRQNGIPKMIGPKQGFLVEGEYDYPPAFISILSKVPFSAVKKYEFLFSPFFDAIHMLCIFYITYYFSGSLSIALVTQLLYMITPIIVIENATATPRSLGYTLFTLTVTALLVYDMSGATWLYVAAIVTSSAIFLSHRFTSQGFLFFAIGYMFLFNSSMFIQVFILGFTLAVVLSNGFYLKVLRGHIGNLVFWYKNIGYRFAHQIRGNDTKQKKTNDFVFRVYNQFLKFPPFVLTITNPWVLASFWVVLNTGMYSGITLLPQLLYWIVFFYVVALLTIWVPQLRFLGEGQRYLELSAFPSAYIASLVLHSFLPTSIGPLVIAGYAMIGIACLVTIIVIQKKAIIHDTLRTLTPSMQDIYSVLKNKKKKPKLLCIPHQITTSTIYHTGCPVFVNAAYSNEMRISDVYPYMRKKPRTILQEKQLDMILLNTDYATLKDIGFDTAEVVEQRDNFLLIKPKRA